MTGRVGGDAGTSRYVDLNPTAVKVIPGIEPYLALPKFEGDLDLPRDDVTIYRVELGDLDRMTQETLRRKADAFRETLTAES